MKEDGMPRRMVEESVLEIARVMAIPSTMNEVKIMPDKNEPA